MRKGLSGLKKLIKNLWIWRKIYVSSYSYNFYLFTSHSTNFKKGSEAEFLSKLCKTPLVKAGSNSGSGVSMAIDFPAHFQTKVFYIRLVLPWEKAMAPHSSTPAWKIPWTEEPGRLQSMGSLRVRHDWVTSLSLSTFMHWRRKWQPTPVFLPGESHGQRSLVGCSPWGRTESDTTEATWLWQRCCPPTVPLFKEK